MLPLGLLNAAQGHPMLVELKNGETLNGHLVLCDTWMNLTLREVTQTSPEGNKFMRLPEVYVKGNNVRSVYGKEGAGTMSSLFLPQLGPRELMPGGRLCHRSSTCAFRATSSKLQRTNNRTRAAATEAGVAEDRLEATTADAAAETADAAAADRGEEDAAAVAAAVAAREWAFPVRVLSIGRAANPRDNEWVDEMERTYVSWSVSHLSR
ncbi:hypothetical protein B0T26DRAFT_701844 [Lasiosphaeria miniovina]|uniref:LSM complex subunit LSM4 n=1 Tax=Lasiosphaeria miniovina TaxID=1954250 RepID=A0AA40AUF3_9PEZI|nr:uncharacterized protein B0T26DRAFT_701844 [Lasiosphaeria miniovina]KAK0722215.1 hypothetical protein B0T26DRAFT_701844 [Lasiosphaeria miniovina]